MRLITVIITAAVVCVFSPRAAVGEVSQEADLDALVRAEVQARGMTPAPPCSDEIFIRRAYLDVIGVLPKPSEVTQFLRNSRPDKRARCIEMLLTREEFADYCALKWGDLLRVKAEFPINLWPNAVQAYHRWIRDAVKNNMPYDAFARTLLTSSGSNFRVGPVNFYRAVQGREPAAIAAAVALTFMGTRVESWPEEQRAGLEAFFSRITYKETDEWKEEIVCWEPPDSAAPLQAIFPDGTPVTIPADKDPRAVFAAWLTAPENPWFARATANRVWSWFLGRGIIHEPDDIRPDNPPVNPDLLAFLERELVKTDYDIRHLYRIILNSATYQQSSMTGAPYPEAEAIFACYPVRRLEAEVISDALNDLFGSVNAYSSLIPEPYTFIPEEHRSITLADGSITSSFLETFGRPARDTGLESERNNQVTVAQRLYLLNSSDVQRRIVRGIKVPDPPPPVKKGAAKAGAAAMDGTGTGKPAKASAPAARKAGPLQAVRQAYLQVLSRFPTEGELATIRSYAQSGQLSPKEVREDVIWALINSKEFLYRH